MTAPVPGPGSLPQEQVLRFLTVTAFNRGIAALEDLQARISAEYDRLSATYAVLSRTGVFGGAVEYLAEDGMFRLGEAIGRGLQEVQKVVASSSPLTSMFMVSLDMPAALLGPISGMANQVTTYSNDNLLYWSGKAADAYKLKQTTQRGAVEKTADTVAFASKWLYEIGHRSIEYIVTMVNDLGGALTKLIEVTVDGASGVSVMFAVDKLGETISALVNVLIEHLSAIVQRFSESVGDLQKMLDNLYNRSHPFGTWPQAVFRG